MTSRRLPQLKSRLAGTAPRLAGTSSCRTWQGRKSNAATTLKTELDDPPFIIGLRPLLLALVARCIPSSGSKHGLHNLIRLIEFSRYDDSEAFWLPAIFAATFLLGGFLLLRRPHATPAVPVIPA
jgi:hypothetical protein